MPTVAKKRKRGFPTGFVLMLVALGCAGAGAYYFWQKTQAKQVAAVIEKKAAVDEAKTQLAKLAEKQAAAKKLVDSGQHDAAIAAYDALLVEVRASKIKDTGGVNRLIVAIETDRDAAKAAQVVAIAAAREAKRTKIDKVEGAARYEPKGSMALLAARVPVAKLVEIKPSRDPLDQGRVALSAERYADAIVAVTPLLGSGPVGTPLRLQATLIAAAAEFGLGKCKDAIKRLDAPWVRTVIKQNPQFASKTTALAAICCSGDPETWGRGLLLLVEHVQMNVLRGSDPMACDELVDLLGTQLDQWTTAGKAKSSKFDDWSRCYQQAVAKLEALNSGRGKWGATWISAAERAAMKGAAPWLTKPQLLALAVRCAS